MLLSEKLTLLRRGQRLSQQQLAERMEVSRQAVSGWETGKMSPSLDNLHRLSKLYGVPLESLLQEEGQWPQTSPPPAGEPREKSGKALGWVKWLVLECCLLAVVCLLMFLALHRPEQKSEEGIPLNELTRGKVEIEPDTDFSFEWKEGGREK